MMYQTLQQLLKKQWSLHSYFNRILNKLHKGHNIIFHWGYRSIEMINITILRSIVVTSVALHSDDTLSIIVDLNDVLKCKELQEFFCNKNVILQNASLKYIWKCRHPP